MGLRRRHLRCLVNCVPEPIYRTVKWDGAFDGKLYRYRYIIFFLALYCVSISISVLYRIDSEFMYDKVLGAKIAENARNSLDVSWYLIYSISHHWSGSQLNPVCVRQRGHDDDLPLPTPPPTTLLLAAIYHPFAKHQSIQHAFSSLLPHLR
jgi:hypothetical protein